MEHGFIKKSSIPALSAIVLFSSTACAVNAMIGVVTPISRSSVAVIMPSAARLDSVSALNSKRVYYP